jgi:hypothetical protein
MQEREKNGKGKTRGGKYIVIVKLGTYFSENKFTRKLSSEARKSEL